MSLEDLLSPLISSGYEPCPTEPTSPGNDLPWTAYPELSHYFENASPLSSSSSSYSGDSLQSQSASPPNVQPMNVAFVLPDASSFGDLDISSTGAFFDGINTDMHATNTLAARACSYTPVSSLSSSPPNFESIDVASTIHDASRSASPLSSTPSSSSEISLQSQSSSPPIFQPTDVAFTPADASRSFDALDFWSTEACFDGMDGKKDATNSYRNHTVDDFGFLHPPQVEDDTINDIWDDRVDYGTVRGEHDGTGFGTIAGSISTALNSHASAQRSPFDEVYPLSSVRGGNDFGFYSQGNGAYGLDMNVQSYTTHAGAYRQELSDHAGLRTSNDYLELPQIVPPSSQVYIPRQESEVVLDSVSNHHAGESRPYFENTIVTPPLNSITFNGFSSTEMEADSHISAPSTESSASSTSLPVQESSQARPHAAHSTSVFMPSLDAYAAASSSKTTLNQVFKQDQVPSQAVAITDAKFNTFGRIGRSTASKGESKKAKRKPYQKSPHGPSPSRREMQPPPSESHRFIDGRHKYERLTDLEIRNLLEIYNVAEEQVSSVFYGLRRQHTSDTLYICPMDKVQLTLAQFEAHCMKHHSTVACDPACPNQGNKAPTNHTNLCRWAITCHAHASYPSVHSTSVAMRHFENMHLRTHGLQCAHCESVHEGVRTLFRHMADGRGCKNMTEWRHRQ
ncbi:hypothetical protein ARMGADRAFT_219541 [Armillaria gallica]|uniref:Uncharacterized protein n=1 Tax=Armillaria gallica TaxID=47427 RepID=A0A2H3DBW7_ARMGA|nr:hypothetical protein ARMGADRAFT_219541 [Armillaria gallica]